MKSTVRLTIVVLMAGYLAAAASADVIGTFVDATIANTTALDGSTAISTDSAERYNGLWWDRDAWGQDDGGILESRYVDPLTLKTVISGLAAGAEYDVYVLYSGWSSATAPLAGLDSESLVSVADSSFIVATGGGSYGDNDILQALVGQAVADASGQINVYIDGDSSGGRTWYDGVAYSAVPEPATLGLLLMGGMGLLRCRRA